MKRLLPVLFLATVLASPVHAAEETQRPDDRIVLDLAAEDWVTTKTAHVTLTVEAAVNGSNAGTTRTEMNKSINDAAKADWRLTGFDRTQDQTGLEHWSATFEARLPESQLNGLADQAKRLSKPGMQISVADIDFTPTLDEREAALAAVRTQIYKSASEQLGLLNGALPGRNYRIAMINFTHDDGPQAVPMMARARAPRPMMALASSAVSSASSEAPTMERAEKITLNARVIFAANPPAGAAH